MSVVMTSQDVDNVPVGFIAVSLGLTWGMMIFFAYQLGRWKLCLFPIVFLVNPLLNWFYVIYGACTAGKHTWGGPRTHGVVYEPLQVKINSMSGEILEPKLQSTNFQNITAASHSYRIPFSVQKEVPPPSLVRLGRQHVKKRALWTSFPSSPSGLSDPRLISTRYFKGLSTRHRYDSTRRSKSTLDSSSCTQLLTKRSISEPEPPRNPQKVLITSCRCSVQLQRSRLSVSPAPRRART